MRRIIAAVGSAGLLAAVLWYRGPAEMPSRPLADDTPEACIDRLFEAAQQGDVPAYLHCFAGAERARMERQLAGSDEKAFGQSLKEATRSLKGLAVMRAGGTAEPDGLQVERIVDRVYEHHHEQQKYRLAQRDGQWCIVEVLPVESQQPLVPYGTPVVALPESTTTGP